MNFEEDARRAKAKYVKKSLETRDWFNFAHPRDVLTGVKIYSGDFYGSSLWNLNGTIPNQIYNVWQRTIKDVMDLPLQTHKYLANELSSLPSVKTDILTRFTGFYRKLLDSPSLETRFLANLLRYNIGSDTGHNLRLIEETSRIDPVTSPPAKVKFAMRLKKTLTKEEVRTASEVSDLLSIYHDAVYLGVKLDDCEDIDNLKEIIDSLCVA